ncbi:MAG TPA: XrtA/PEP-CTERM system TPR-repeat protein PrsT [Acetobacteraceae bacterium]|jgi:putative PEP-CTERM system TPR-repeat lipoprotein
MRHRSLIWLLLGAWIGIWPLAAHADYLSSARNALKKGDLRTAQIDLRNAVRADPQNAEAHYYLGQVSFELGDPVAAEHEAAEAQNRGFDPHLAVRLLAQSLMAQGKFDDLLNRLKPGGKDANLDASILVFRGYAQIGLKQLDAAQASFAQAEQEAPNAIEPLLAEARLAASRGDMAGAEAKIDKAVSEQPKSAEALLAKSQLLRMKGDAAGALAVLDTLLADQPSIVQARLDRASLEIALNKTKEAGDDIDMVLKATPGNVQALYLQSVMKVQAGDFKGADAELERISAYIPRIPRGYFLVAVVKEHLGELEQADDAARRYLARAPNDLAAYKILARIQFIKHRPDQVIDTLTRISEAGKGDAETYDMLGRAYAVTGRATEAVAAFQKAQSMAPKDVGIQTRLASVRMGMGEPNAAMGDLEHTLELAPKLPQVGEALFFAALATGDMQKTADALAKVQAAEGDTDVVQNLDGLYKLAKLDLTGAHTAFAAIVQKYPDFLPAQVNLARVDAMQGQGPEAEKLLANILSKHPTAEPALTMLATDYTQTNRLPDAIKLLEAAHASDPTNEHLTANLAEFYVRAAQPQKSLDLLNAVKGGTQTSVPLLAAVASSELALGQKDKARDTYAELLKLDPQQLAARQQLISLYVDAGDFGSARNVAKAGIAAMPQNYQLLQDYVMIDLKATGVDAALATADNLYSQDRNFTLASALRGDVYLAANRPDDAITAYSDALQKAPITPLLTRLIAAQLRANRVDDARNTLLGWVGNHPDDVVALEQLAEVNIATSRLDDASKNLQAILAKKPHDAVALNNLAWIYGQQHDPRAMDLARQAYVLSPGAQTADTLGWILTSSGKAAVGVDLLRQASAQATNDPRVQYHYAVALNDTGNKKDAIKLLTAVVAVKANFTEKAQAQQLLDQLNKGS